MSFLNRDTAGITHNPFNTKKKGTGITHNPFNTKKKGRCIVASRVLSRWIFGIVLSGVLAAPALAAPTEQATALFRQYCMGGDGDLAAVIEAMDASADFDNRSGRDIGAMRYASFTGPADINASVKIGFSTVDDHCSIILRKVNDPMATSEQIAEALAKPTQTQVQQFRPFGDYGKGGYGMIGFEDRGDIVVAPLTTGISPNIVHINYYPVSE